MKLQASQLTHRLSADHPALQADAVPDESQLIPGQPRATKALEQGIAIDQPGYNLYLAGKNGIGRVRYVMKYLAPLAANGETPQDWLYVKNFDNSSEPHAISMPPEKGLSLIRDINKLIDALLATFPTVFENPSYLQQKTALQKTFDQTYDQAVEVVERSASAMQIAVYREDSSITFTPIIDGQVADESMFAQMGDEQRETFRENVETLQTLLNDSLLELPQWQRDFNHKLRELLTSTINQSLKPLFDQLQQSYQGHTGVQLYLVQVSSYLPRFIEENLNESQSNLAESIINKRALLEDLFLPNLITRSTHNSGAPIIQESNPSHANLFGRINIISEQGSLKSNHRQIIAGSLHRANGGFLILDIEKVLSDPSTWKALKRCLRDEKIYMEPPENEIMAGLPQLLKPVSIPLKAKIILIGPRDIYYTLERFDHDFDELFRVLVDFSSQIDNTPENLKQFTRNLLQRAKEANVAKLSNSAISRLVEYASRVAEHQLKFTACIDPILELVIEADHSLQKAHDTEITEKHINRAINSREQRNARLYDLVKEDILGGSIVITTTGSAVGQTNGLSVIQVGESNFGCPVRITATVHPGKLGVVDIEREVELGRAVHSKGVLLLSGYLCGRYCKEFPLAISAHLAMEQSYGYVDGDSASLAEICALLSALINAPLRQDLAITGSVNQRGEVQAVGGVNEKIEGFFDICNARGLSGTQGVLIPASNSINLMLSETVINAVENNTFNIYTVSSVDEALHLLTGMEIGEANLSCVFPSESFNEQVVKRLTKFSTLLKNN
tara:strand:- start:24124 stop:26490 length:2367 start_codon:yes stop_codon:yes gene_type:complete